MKLNIFSVIDEVEVEGDAYSFDDDEENQPQAEEKTGSGQFKEPAEIFNIVFKNLKKPNRKTAFVLNWADYLFSSGGQLPPDERELITMLGKAIKDKKAAYKGYGRNAQICPKSRNFAKGKG